MENETVVGISIVISMVTVKKIYPSVNEKTDLVYLISSNNVIFLGFEFGYNLILH